METVKGLLEGIKNLASIVKSTQAQTDVTPKKRVFIWYALGLAVLAAVALIGCWLFPWYGPSKTDKRIDALRKEMDATVQRTEQTIAEGKRREGAAIHAAIVKSGKTDADRLPVLLAGLLCDWRKEHAEQYSGQ